jgi:peptidoglycan/xylan/chitin deacetylase (PgdA/CDA1 family)
MPGAWDGLRRVASKWRNQLYPCTIVLLYHRVADTACDPFGLAVSPKNFAEQAEVLSSLGCVTRLPELYQRKVPRGRAVVTFDDGYADNLLAAKPILEKFGISATFFISTAYIGSNREFWWDELARVLLTPVSLPETLRVSANGKEYCWHVGGCAKYPEAVVSHAGWRSDQPAPTTRHKLFLKIHAELQPLSHAERRDIIDQVFEQSGLPTNARASYRPMTETELAELAGSPLMDIGSHTVTHPRLAALQEFEQRFEITRSRDILQEILARPVRTFSYPFGARDDYSPQTCAILVDAGFELACTAFAGVLRRQIDRFQVPRMYVRDWSGDEFARQLRARLDG